MDAVATIFGVLSPFIGMGIGALYCAYKRGEQLDENYRILYPDRTEEND